MLSIPADDEGMSTLRVQDSGEGWEKIEVRIQRGDEALSGLRMSGRVFLKVDVEGYEASVLTGIRTLLDSRIDHASVEIHTPIIGPSGVEEVFAVLAESGLEARRFEDHTPMTAADVTGEEQVLFQSVGAPRVTPDIAIVKALRRRV